jgi:hypothetical protein
MPEIRSRVNQYRGINAHLHSHYQGKGGWDEFHRNHIPDITGALKEKLLPLGYTAKSEASLQIHRLDKPAGKPKSDVTIYDQDPTRAKRPPSGSQKAAHGIRLPEFMNFEEELAPYSAIVIYKFKRDTSERGEPVGWIELLSPSNKPGGQDAALYRDRRVKLLQTGLVFVELDYLHESPSTFESIAPYSASSNGESNAHPYRIVVLDPRPNVLKGEARPVEFDADDPIPEVNIPLNGDDILTFDFDVPYQKTYVDLLYGLEELVDYSQLPINFDRYSRADQLRIIMRVGTVVKAVNDGVDIEANAPLPIDPTLWDDSMGNIGWKPS